MLTDAINFPGSGSLSGAKAVTLSSSGPNLPSTGSLLTNDVLEAATLSESPSSSSSGRVTLPTPSLSIVDFSDEVNAATDTNSEVNYQSQQYDDVKLKNFYNGNVISALELLQLYNQLSAIAPGISQIFSNETSNESTLNAQINSTNSGLIANDNSQITIMNQAISAYQNGDITKAQYFSAVSTYNTYVASRSSAVTTANNQIAAYNGSVATTNSAIDSENTQLSNLDFQTLNHQSSYSQTVGSLPALSTTVPTSNTIAAETPLGKVKLSISPDLSNASTSTIIQYFFSPLFNLVNGNLQNSTKQLNDFSTYQGFLQFVHQSAVASLPASFKTSQPQLTNSGSVGGVGQGSGVSLSTMVTSLSNPVMARIIDTQKFNTENTLLSQPEAPHLINQVQYLNLQTLAQLGLSAGSPSARLLIGRLSSYDTESSPVSLTVALAFSSQLLKASQTPDFKNGVTTLLQNAGVPAANVPGLADQLTAASKLFQFQVAASQIGTALNNPQFSTQLLSTVDSTKQVASDQTNQQLNLQDVMNNSVSTGFLKTTLANQVVEDGALEQQQAANAVNHAINQSIATNDTLNSQAQLQSSLKEQLVQQGITSSEAQKLSVLASSYTQAEIAGNNQLDLKTSSEHLNASNLVKALTNQNIQQATAQTAVSQTLANGDFQSNRELRDRLSSELVAQGVTHSTALQSSTQALVPYGGAPNSIQSLSATGLNEQVTAQVVHLLSPSVGSEKAHAVASQAISTINGIRSGIDDNMKVLQNHNNVAVNDALDDQVRSFLKPTLSLYTFNQNLLDPARTLINMWSVMTQHSLPSNFQKTTDLLV